MKYYPIAIIGRHQITLLHRFTDNSARKQLLGSLEVQTEKILRRLLRTTGSSRLRKCYVGCYELVVTAFTRACDGGTRTLEQFLKAVAYDFLETAGKFCTSDP
ncbi:hypothetical protein T4E_8836 [Trichinella pseudospiralis]|uniref:Uncharacterized protein n=1 Tax=Trichinella pseudospiralis TaxID=6337 RepID=A0A0V0YIV0_TRIPS|nr:hypothetical protein T4E_8836 [Trichinella pseudospiralis]